MSRSAKQWQFWIDRGGTFTDVVARAPDGSIVTHKLLPENPERYRDAAVQGIRTLLGIGTDGSVPAEEIAAVKIGHDRGDQRPAGAQGRPHGARRHQGLRRSAADRLSEPAGHLRSPHRPAAAALRGGRRGRRAHGPDGEVLRPIDLAAARRALQEAHDQGIRAAAIVFMHGYRYTAHEKAAASLARDIGFTQISVSHEVSPLLKLVGRGDTTVVDAYLSPILCRYVDSVAVELGDGTVVPLIGTAKIEMNAGDVFVIETPGGGGFGRTQERKAAAE